MPHLEALACQHALCNTWQSMLASTSCRPCASSSSATEYCTVVRCGRRKQWQCVCAPLHVDHRSCSKRCAVHKLPPHMAPHAAAQTCTITLLLVTNEAATYSQCALQPLRHAIPSQIL